MKENLMLLTSLITIGAIGYVAHRNVKECTEEVEHAHDMMDKLIKERAILVHHMNDRKEYLSLEEWEVVQQMRQDRDENRADTDGDYVC